MSAIVGILSAPGRELPGDDVARRMLDRMRSRGAEHAEMWRGEHALLGAARHDWELGTAFSGSVIVLQESDVSVAADATILYRDDLIRAIERQGVRLTGDTTSHLILAAYRAWGERCAEHLEGDFAFVLWDRAEQKGFAARDFAGTRPLFHGKCKESLVVASAPGSIAAHPDCSGELDWDVIAAAAGGIFTVGRRTCYRGVSALTPGTTLIWSDGRVRVTPHWSVPPIDPGGRRIPFEEAATELKRLLSRAVEERMDPLLPTAVWLSGGWDSTAVFGAGEHVLRQRGAGEHLQAVSISYPPGDPGREDELIRDVTDHWGSPVRWVRSAEIPLLDNPTERAAARDEPFAHAFEMWNRALGRASRATGARVALHGNGGDQFFQVSNIYMADLLRTGQWIQLAGEWRAKGLRGSGWRTFFYNTVRPNLSAEALQFATRLRGGRALRAHLERVPPAWIRSEVAERLAETERNNAPPRRERSHASQEMFWYLAHEYPAWVSSVVAGLALDEGIETRSPLYDRRVVEFAASRPRWERSSGRETKRLLRKAMHGLLPDHVLAPRENKTGTTTGYFQREMRSAQAGLIARALDEPLALEAADIIDGGVLREQCRRFLQSGDIELGMSLFFTLQTEIWLREHVNGPVRTEHDAEPRYAAAGGSNAVL